MNLLLPEGSHAIVDPEDRRLFNGKLYLLRNAEGEATIKRYRTDPARFEPVSDNPDYLPFEIGQLDFSIIGRVTSGLQKF
jgi:SOS-response transcriptional repressor LexA